MRHQKLVFLENVVRDHEYLHQRAIVCHTNVVKLCCFVVAGKRLSLTGFRT